MSSMHGRASSCHGGASSTVKLLSEVNAQSSILLREGDQMHRGILFFLLGTARGFQLRAPAPRMAALAETIHKPEVREAGYGTNLAKCMLRRASPLNRCA